MSELRQRRGEGDGNDKVETGESDHVDSEEEKNIEEKYVDEMAKNLPQGTDKTPEILDSALSGLSSRWRNWVIRGIFTWLMIGAFCLLIYGGPLALMITVLCVQVKCFEEIINIGYAVYRVHGLPWFRSLSWYFLLTSNYFFYGENLIDYFGVVINRTVDSEEEKNIEEKYVDEMAKNLPQGTDKTPEILDSALSGLSSRWRNWVIRGIFTWLMIGAFCLLIYGGPLALMITVLCVQVKCFEEIINIGYAVYRVHGLPWFRSLSWYFLLTSNYFFYGENLIDYFGVVINRTDYLKFLVTYHRFISFSLYCVGFVWFVLSLVKRYYMRQFSLFAWTHVALLIVVTQSYLIIQNIFEGFIWFIVPVSMIICNDVMAYVFGFFFGKTPLIKLSPKKTWEGFIGGGISTVVFGLIIAYFMSQYPYFVCPIEYSESLGRMTMDCEPSQLFRLQQYTPPQFVQPLMKIIGMEKFNMYPFMIHSLSLSVFSSVIGPFGGFFASGFKRAFKIKDFGDVIPGHGGIMDRFDCQFLMATFVNVYITSFIRTATPQKLLQQVYNMKPEQQLQLFYALKESLENRNILNLVP